jgi:two-component system sensor histidine kinase BaeS
LTSLRVRLLFSHVIPSILIIPIMGLGLVYVLENHYLLPTLKRDLMRDADLIASLTHDQNQIWQDPVYAQGLLNIIRQSFIERTMLLRPDGTLLASTDPADDPRLNQVIQLKDLQLVRSGQQAIRTTYNPYLRGEVVDVVAPVVSGAGQIVGVVRLTYHYETIYEDLVNLRFLIGLIFLLGLTTTLTVGSFSAIQISRPIRMVTQRIFEIARGYSKEELVEKGDTELRLLANSVNFLVKRLEDLEQARRHLLANLVHELGRPIGALRSANQALLKGAYRDPDFSNELLIGMDAEFDRLQSTLNDLAHLNDQVLGPLELNRQPVDPGVWLAKALSPWHEAALDRRLRWEVALPSQMPVVDIDVHRMGQVVGNLVSNAIKYTPPGGRISITAGTEPAAFWISVQDTGPGISAGEQAAIFSPFYRAGRTRQSAPGMGIGLSVARDIVIAHGGEIRLESAPGMGSTFTVHIPLVPEAVV